MRTKPVLRFFCVGGIAMQSGCSPRVGSKMNGSVVVWLCQTTTTPAPATVAGLTPSCPQSGTVTGQITAANVISAATASQQITAGELAKVIAAIRAGFAYVNVHATPLNPGGEIRGQVRASREERGGDRD